MPSSYNGEFDPDDYDLKTSKTKHKWSGRYKATYGDMAKTQHELAGLEGDIKTSKGNAKNTARRGKLRKKHGDKKVHRTDGALNSFKRRLKKKK